MPQSRTYDGMTPEIWERIRSLGQRDHGTVFAETSAESGIASTNTPVGKVVLGYALDWSKGCVTYTLLEKPMLAPAAMIWSGLEQGLERCRNESSS